MSHDLLEAFGAVPVKERVVVDGNVMTGGGVTAGIDFALVLAAEILGEQEAKQIQLAIEYDPKPPFDAGSPETAGRRPGGTGPYRRPRFGRTRGSWRSRKRRSRSPGPLEERRGPGVQALNDKIFAYCERGLDPGLWAEPVNALTNGAFVIAGLAALYLIRQRPPGERSIVQIVLAVLVVLIGIGSFLFHTQATAWAAIADVAPIGIFMLLYFAVAMRSLLRLPLGWAMVLTMAFAACLWAAGRITCGPDGLVEFAGGGGRCLNGSVGYLPALAAMLAIGGVLALKRHPGGAIAADRRRHLRRLGHLPHPRPRTLRRNRRRRHPPRHPLPVAHPQRADAVHPDAGGDLVRSIEFGWPRRLTSTLRLIACPESDVFILSTTAYALETPTWETRL